MVTHYSLSLVVAGIGPTTAALCVSDLAKCLGPKFKELIYSGTSGWSAAVGGILNADDCKKASTTHKVSFEFTDVATISGAKPTGSHSFQGINSFITVLLSSILFHW